MKTKSILFIFLTIPQFCLNAQKQTMDDLYKFAIEDCYETHCKKGYLSNQDTMYLIWCCYDCNDNCFEYSLQPKNDRIIIGMPFIDKNSSAVSVYRLVTPKLEGECISISIIPFSAYYDEETEGINLIRASTIIYRFKYSKKKSKFLFASKEEDGI
jgi:hypothetical protein